MLFFLELCVYIFLSSKKLSRKIGSCLFFFSPFLSSSIYGRARGAENGCINTIFVQTEVRHAKNMRMMKKMKMKKTWKIDVYDVITRKERSKSDIILFLKSLYICVKCWLLFLVYWKPATSEAIIPRVKYTENWKNKLFVWASCPKFCSSRLGVFWEF